MTYRSRLTFLIFIDSLIVLSAIYLSYFILHPDLQIYTIPTLFISSITLLVSHHFFASVYHLYKKAWEYASVPELLSITKSVTFSVITAAAIQLLINGDIYVRVLMIAWMLHMLLIGGSRFSWRVLRSRVVRQENNKKRTLIVGAGAAGTMVVRQLLSNQETELKPIAFIDDDKRKHHLDILGLPVLGDSSLIEQVVKEKEIDNIVIAIPSLSKKELNVIFEECSKTTAKTQIMPMIEDLMVGKVSVNHFRDVQVEDLLGREQIELDTARIAFHISDKVVLVTGAGGSIGSEICRQIMNFHPDKIVLLGHGENSIYSIELDLRTLFPTAKTEIVTEIADIQDRNKIFTIMETHRPNIVYHAAAHKHVPLMERNPEEAVKNNIFGTKNVAEASATFAVETFVLVSSDKAVNPTNVMGATKRFAELVIQDIDRHSETTKFVAVRFGNVLGSRGSVIPLFKKQIQAGGPVTVTHPEMTRYFMTIPEASRLVIQASVLGRGGEIFVLDMGEPVKIVDLARNLIKLSGYSIEEIGIKYSGIRPGEKMYEELLNEEEVHKEQVFPKIHIGKAANVDQAIIYNFIKRFEQMEINEVKSYLLDVANNRFINKDIVEVS
ncbi:polysaccharide biosynthesis protein [Bacillus suaedaesalsae]|uniref:Polysaccharide biosynthesis protein n=1 Tax=Bacillus suaedaesalsae TaxID=2810349 RepID=A0ABS2DKU9_9BACI|nr:nucleoside-diphosphate sugar epimerase/dehydratase [Bacillus suaedaesalsae]MBM6619103.1 polysaccharide biosynthesis protein [Bacillus suaedaesalsae]